MFRGARGAEPAIVHASESRALAELSWDSLAMRLRAAPPGCGGWGWGGATGSRLPAERARNRDRRSSPRRRIGAIWSSCAPEFGAPTVVDRFAQIEPKVLIATEGYRYGGK